MPYKSIEINSTAAVHQQPIKTSQFYVGFSSIDIGNTNSKLYDLELIQQDFLNYFNTRRGERVMNPKFGTIIWDIIMEPMTPEIYDLLEADIKTICSSDPRVAPTQINITEKPGGYLIEITLVLIGTDKSSKLRLDFNQISGLSVH